MPKSRWAGGSADTSRPFWRIVPEVCGSRPAMARSKVVLPQPEGPRKQTNSPSAMSSEISPRAVKSPKRFERLRTSRYDMLSARGQRPSPPVQRGEREGTRAQRGEGEVGCEACRRNPVLGKHHLTPITAQWAPPSPPLRGGAGL